MRLIACITPILLWADVVFAIDTPQNHFIVPPLSGTAQDYTNNLVLSLGSNQVIQWTTNMSYYEMDLWQQFTSQAAATKIATIFSASDGNGASDSSFPWTVQTYGANLTVTNIFFLWVNHDSPTGFTSHYFNISGSQASSTSSTVSQTSTASSSASSSTSATTTAPPASTQTGDGKSSSKTGLDIGLGVGIGLGVVLILLAGIWLGFRMAKRRAAARNKQQEPQIENFTDETKKEDTNNHWPEQGSQYSSPVKQQVPPQIYSQDLFEAPNNPRIFEAPNGSRPTAELE